MELHLLRIFVTIAEVSSLTKASQKLNYVQSNLSARLKQLEEELGCSLFSRTKKGMFLTESGEKLFPQAKEMLKREEEIKNEMQRPASVNQVTFAVPDSFMRVYMSNPLTRWRKMNPEAKVRIKTAFSPQVAEYLDNKEVDIGVVISRTKPSNLHVIAEFKSELCVVTPKTVEELSTKNLNGLQPLLLGDACFFGQSLLQLYNEFGVFAEKHEYLFSIETILQCISLGLGVSVFPKCLIDVHPQRGNVTIHKFPKKRNFSFYKVCLPEKKGSQLVQSINEVL